MFASLIDRYSCPYSSPVRQYPKIYYSTLRSIKAAVIFKFGDMSRQSPIASTINGHSSLVSF